MDTYTHYNRKFQQKMTQRHVPANCIEAAYLTFEVWITITALYFLPTFACSLGVPRLETFM